MGVPVHELVELPVAVYHEHDWKDVVPVVEHLDGSTFMGLESTGVVKHFEPQARETPFDVGASVHVLPNDCVRLDNGDEYFVVWLERGDRAFSVHPEVVEVDATKVLLSNGGIFVNRIITQDEHENAGRMTHTEWLRTLEPTSRIDLLYNQGVLPVDAPPAMHTILPAIRQFAVYTLLFDWLDRFHPGQLKHLVTARACFVAKRRGSFVVCITCDAWHTNLADWIASSEETVLRDRLPGLVRQVRLFLELTSSVFSHGKLDARQVMVSGCGTVAALTDLSEASYVDGQHAVGTRCDSDWADFVDSVNQLVPSRLDIFFAM